MSKGDCCWIGGYDILRALVPSNRKIDACRLDNWLGTVNQPNHRHRKTKSNECRSQGRFYPWPIPVVAAQVLNGTRGLWKDGEKT